MNFKNGFSWKIEFHARLFYQFKKFIVSLLCVQSFLFKSINQSSISCVVLFSLLWIIIQILLWQIRLKPNDSKFRPKHIWIIIVHHVWRFFKFLRFCFYIMHHFSSMAALCWNFDSLVYEFIVCEWRMIWLLKFTIELFFLFLLNNRVVNQRFYFSLIFKSDGRWSIAILLTEYLLSLFFWRLIEGNIILFNPSQTSFHQLFTSLNLNLTLKNAFDLLIFKSKDQNLLIFWDVLDLRYRVSFR